MDKFNTLPEEERKTAYTEVSRRLSLPPTAAEKDFWVCWTLHQLVTAKELGEYLTFKGGTSLSKAYGLVDRFSEDIDLTIGHDARFLKDGAEPMEDGISGKERDRRIKALKVNAQSFVAEVAFPILEQKIKDSLGEHGNWNLTLDEKDNDRQTILFHYPRLMNYGMGFGMGGFGVGRFGEGEIGYIKPIVKLEFGARGEIEPSQSISITPYVAEEFPQLFDSPATNVQTLAAERTFWEKVTILHALHHGTHIRDRMSRHYYDTYIMDQKGVTEAALIHDRAPLFPCENV